MSAPPGDLREGGEWTRAQRAKNDVLWLLARAAVATLGRLPPRALRAAGAALGVLAHAILPGTRRLAERNVALALPELDARARRALVAQCYRTLGGHLGDAVAMLDPRRPIALLPFAEGSREALDRAIATGRGVVFASAHLGPWERVAATLVARGIDFTAVAREPYDPRLASLYERMRGGRGLRTIYRGAPGAATRLVRTLRRGAVLGIPMDLASRVPSVDVPFLGHLARTPVGPARLALRTGAEVLVGVPAPHPGGGGTLELAISRVVADDLDTSTESERILSTRINDALSLRIRALPASWVWMHPRWQPSITTL
ncbi:MAG TPA: lysophospholipid acyltransferase family protein [Labilithrix sp.]|nr:lysophospholipid acyltransferase family protein [Labilithrix sp.]